MKLKEYADIVMGQSPKGETYNSNNDGTPFMQGRKTFGRMYPSIDTWTTNPLKIAEANSILMSVRAPVGDMNIAKEKICIGRGLCSIIAKNSNTYYLYYNLLYNMYKLKAKSNGTVFDSVNKNDLENLDLFIHSEEEQKKIEKILLDIDKKIELNNEINDN
ncbi:MAG: restriction endonuclease subunit S, partial [Clostridia bacterium]|nr:restriction endonuclease subunit S [Clostridia bacterium]